MWQTTRQGNAIRQGKVSEASGYQNSHGDLANDPWVADPMLYILRYKGVLKILLVLIFKWKEVLCSDDTNFLCSRSKIKVFRKFDINLGNGSLAFTQ